MQLQAVSGASVDGVYVCQLTVHTQLSTNFCAPPPSPIPGPRELLVLFFVASFVVLKEEEADMLQETSHSRSAFRPDPHPTGTSSHVRPRVTKGGGAGGRTACVLIGAASLNVLLCVQSFRYEFFGDSRTTPSPSTLRGCC